MIRLDMFEYHTLRACLGIMQIGIVWVLWRNDIGYLWRFGLAMLAGAVVNIAPAYPSNDAWKHYIQIPAYTVLLGITVDATLEFFAFLRRRTFIEERMALLGWAGVMGLIPVWIFWWWPGENAYQDFMLARQYALLWLASSYLCAWIWLRAVRPVHAELQIADHGEFWGFWLASAAAMASTTKWGIVWRFAQWRGGEDIWRMAVDAMLIAQICICFGFAVNLWRWRQASDVVQDEQDDPLSPAHFQRHRLLHL